MNVLIRYDGRMFRFGWARPVARPADPAIRAQSSNIQAFEILAKWIDRDGRICHCGGFSRPIDAVAYAQHQAYRALHGLESLNLPS